MDKIHQLLLELWPFVNDNALFMRIWQKRGHPCPMDTFLVFFLLSQLTYSITKVDYKMPQYVHFQIISVCTCFFGFWFFICEVVCLLMLYVLAF